MNHLRLASYIVFASGIATLLSMYVFSNHPELIMLSLTILGLIMLITLRNGQYVPWYVVAFILGPIILDIPGIHFGLWSFGTPQFLEFPLWLPFFYGNITVSFLHFALTTQGWIGRR